MLPKTQAYIQMILQQAKKNLKKFKTMDNLKIIDKVITSRNSKHLNQAQDSPFIVKLVESLLGTTAFTAFADGILEGTANIDSIQILQTLKTYTK